MMPGFRRFRRVLGPLLVVGLLAGCATPPVRSGADGSIEGRYQVTGTASDGRSYSGVLLVEAEDDGYRLEWVVTEAVLEGRGDLVGDRLEAEWRTVRGIDPSLHGTVVYVVGDDGTLRGERIVAGGDVFVETAVRVE